MRKTNNEENSSLKHPDDDVYYVVYDTDTCEYLTDWDTDQDSGEIEFQQWQELNWDEVLQDIRKFDTAVLSYSRKNAERLLLDVAADLCDRFPTEVINLQVRQLTVKIHRTVEVEDVGKVQTFGEDAEEEVVEEDELIDEEEEWGAGNFARAAAAATARLVPRRYTPVEESFSKPKKAKKTTKKKRD